MLKIKSVLLICALSLAAVLSGCGASPSTQPTENVQENAKLAYREILQAAPAIEGEHEELSDASFGYDENVELFGEHYDCFVLSDINQDGVPELIALSKVNFRWAPISVYTYAEGEAVLLKDPLDAEAHGTFEQNSSANGAYITYICEENHIHSVWRGTDAMGKAAEENNAYILEGTTLRATDCAVGETEKTVYFHDVAQANTAENITALGQ